MQPSTPPPPPPAPPQVEIADILALTLQDISDLSTIAAPSQEPPPPSFVSPGEQADEEREAYLRRLTGNVVARYQAYVRLVRRQGARNLPQLIEVFERSLEAVEKASFSAVASVQDSRAIERDMRSSVQTAPAAMGQSFLDMADSSARQAELFTRRLNDYYWLLRELRDAIGSLRQVQDSMSQIDLLASGSFDEPDEIMRQLQISIRNGVAIAAQRLEFLARSRAAKPLIRALALETLAGAREHEFDSLVLDAILDGLRSEDADLRFAAIAAASDLTREKQASIQAYIDEISQSDFDPNVRRAARAFAQVRVALA